MAEKRKKLPLVTTPIVTFRFPKLHEPDYGSKDYPKPDGEYSVQLIMDRDSPEAKELIAALTPHYEEAQSAAREAFEQLPVATRKKLKEPSINPLYSVVYDKETEEPTGEVFFKVSMKASGVFRKGPKEGQKWNRSPVVFDAKGQRIMKVPEIWSGSRGRVSAEVSPYFIPGTGAAGLSLKLVGVQLIELVAGGGRSANELGFGAVEDGYEHASSPEPETASIDDTDADVGNF